MELAVVGLELVRVVLRGDLVALRLDLPGCEGRGFTVQGSGLEV